jgi:Methyltransferase domain
MVCEQCNAIEDIFNQNTAERELRKYRKKGPDRTSRMLIDALIGLGVRDTALIDIGGGVGALQIALLQAGVSRATSVDASRGYLKISQDEAERLGLRDRIRYFHGDFVTLASKVEPAEIVTLVRAICCYPDAEGLVRSSSEKAERYYGLVYPRDTWWLKAIFRVANPIYRIFRRTKFQIFIHPTELVDRIVRSRGFTRTTYRNSGIWQVVVYTR